MEVLRTKKDDEILLMQGIRQPMPELRPAYYKMMKDGEVYHVFNAQRMVS